MHVLFRFADAVNLNPTLSCSERDLEKSVGKWLLNCRDRDGLRKERAEREKAKKKRYGPNAITLRTLRTEEEMRCQRQAPAVLA